MNTAQSTPVQTHNNCVVTQHINNEAYTIDVGNAVALCRELQSVLKDDDLTDEFKKIRYLVTENYPDHLPAGELKLAIAFLEVMENFLPDVFLTAGGSHE